MPCEGVAKCYPALRLYNKKYNNPTLTTTMVLCPCGYLEKNNASSAGGRGGFLKKEIKSEIQTLFEEVFMNQRDQHLLESTAKAEGFPEANAENYITLIQGRPFVTTRGLHYKMRQTYGTSWFVKTVPPTPEEYALFRDMVGPSVPMVVMKGVAEVRSEDGTTHTFEDYGTTLLGNTKGMVGMQNYPIELACRRASNRAMRLATLTGMVSADELDGRQSDDGRPPGTGVPQQKGTYPTHELASKNDVRTYLEKLADAKKDGVLDDEEYDASKAIAQNPRGVLARTLNAALDRLDARMKTFYEVPD